MSVVIYYFEPHGILTPRSIFIHGYIEPHSEKYPPPLPPYVKLKHHGIFNRLISNQEKFGGQYTRGGQFTQQSVLIRNSRQEWVWHSW